MSKTNETVVAWGIDLGTTNSTLCRARLPAGAASPTEPEVVPLRQPTPAGEFTGTLLPSIVATIQGREFVGQGAKDLRALMADMSGKNQALIAPMQELGQNTTRRFLETMLSSESVGLLGPGLAVGSTEVAADAFGLD